VGTTAITFTQFTGVGEIIAGAALTKSGNTLDVSVDNSSIEVSSDALRVKAGGIVNAMIAAGLDAVKIGAGTVSNTVFGYLAGVTSAIQTQLDSKEATANKDATGGYAGLTLFKINFKNAANTFTSFFTNTNSAARTYTFQNRDGTIADDTDLATKQATLTAANAGDFIIGLTSKNPPVDADSILGSNSASGDDAVRFTWTNIKAFLKTYFDTIYTAFGGREVLVANRTYYVRTDGSNSNTGLVDSAGGAFLTAAKVNDVIATIDKNGYNIDVYFGSGNWAETIIIKVGIGDGTVTWHGTLTLTEAVTSATVAAGSGSTAGTVTKTGQFTGNAYEGYIAYYQTDNVHRIIESNTNDALTLADIAASSTTQNVDVKTWGTTLNKITLPTGLTGFVLDKINLTGTSETYSLEMSAYSALEAYTCKFEKYTFIQGANLKEVDDCYFVVTAASAICAALAYGAGGVLVRCYLKANNDTAQGVNISRSSSLLFAGGSINGVAGGNKATYGIRCVSTSTVQCNGGGAGNGNLKVKNCDTGVSAAIVSNVVGTANNSYTSNGANETADAASYGYID
jgi:hypothetical protein